MIKLTLISLLIPLSLFSENNHDSMLLRQVNSTNDSLKVEVFELNDNFVALEKKVDQQENLASLSNESISNQLSAASYSLTIFGLLFGLSAIGLGIYITFIERKVVRIREKNQALLDESNRIKLEVSEMNKMIQENVYGLYDKIRRADTVQMLVRLREVPEDIANLSSALLSRELIREDFHILREAFLRVENEENEMVQLRMKFRDSYKLLFFQHFLDLALKDSVIGPHMLNFYAQGISCCFKNDILKASKEFIIAVTELGIETKLEEIKSFVAGLIISQFKDNLEIYKVFFDGLSVRNQQFKFYEIISQATPSKIAKVHFGRLLNDAYGQTVLNEKEKSAIDEIVALMNEK